MKKLKFDDLTKSQQAAVTQRGSIIVSAAAGSGKTAVLVQRIVDRLTSKENPLSADRLLVVTFTVAAAGEMRSRIEKELDIYCKNNLDDEYAAKQKLLIRSARISTIDSFCIDLVRENFAKSDVSPDFKIAEDKDVALIKEMASTVVFSNYFALKDQDFLNLLDAFGSIYDEKNLLEAVDEIYEKSQNMPFPQVWLSQMLSTYEEKAFDKWSNLAIIEVDRILNTTLRYINAAKEICEKDSDVKNAYLPNFISAQEQCEKIKEYCVNNKWDDILRCAKAFSFGTFGSVSGSKDNPVAIMVKKFRELCEKSVKKIATLLSEELSIAKNRFIEGAPSGKKLIEITKAYCKEIDKIKKEKNIYTFSDIEHFAFSLICHDKDGEIVLNDDANEYISQYDEILVDEYQDVNNLQDRFFYFLSDCGAHLFVVGDVKQSIYGFRGANPENFISAIKESVDYKVATENDRKSITLDANFRSRDGVCKAVNFLFDQLMTEENCGIDYAKTERLYPKAEFPELNIPSSEFHIVNSFGEKEKEAEAKHIAAYIKKIMSEGNVIRDKKTKQLRNAVFSDFAVIVRAMKGNASILVNAFNAAGIPVTYSKDGFLESKEISIMLSLLNVIENPTRDVTLLATMMSPIFGFIADDMAEIRCVDKKSSLYSAVIKSAENNEKCQKFLEKIAEFRRNAVILPLPKLISKIYDSTNLLNVVQMMDDGQGRSANLIHFLHLAQNFVASGNRSISAFIKSLERVGDGKIKGATLSAGNDAVRIMSVHNSKGLQYPVCFFAFSGAAFNTLDQKKPLIIEQNFGVAFRYYNDDGKIDTINKKLLARYSNYNLLKEELRMLYVALTRAEDRLIITASRKNPYSEIAKSALKLVAGAGTIGEDIYLNATCYADWLVPCFLLHSDGQELRDMAEGVDFSVIPAEKMLIKVFDDTEEVALEDKNFEETPDKELSKEIRNRINFVYPFNSLRTIEAKSSVSNIVHKAEVGNFDFTSRPGFLSKNGLTPTERGTAVHTIMQFMDFKAARENFEEEIERLKEWEYITEEQSKVDTAHIKRFVESDLFSRILSAKSFEREMKFLTFMSAENIIENIEDSLKNEKIVVQGAVDLMFIEEDGIVIVDFKTDRVDDEKTLVESYAEQLRIYADACSKITGLKVKEKIIYSLVLDRSIVV